MKCLHKNCQTKTSVMKTSDKIKLNVCIQFLTIYLSMLEAKHDETATAGQFPFMAQIVRVVDTNSTYSVFGNIYGGSLITPKWVLTAGQCFPWSQEDIDEVAKNKSMMVIMGSITSLDFSAASFKRFIIKIIRHPDFQDIITGSMQSVSDDIAVAKVNKKFILNNYAQIISLASPSFLHGEDIIDEIHTCTVMGFGASSTNSKEDHHDNLLTYNKIHLVSSLKFEIPRTANVFISATKPETIQNHGDIGSPVICMDIQFGLVSALVTIDESYVDMYTQIEQYEKFIKKNVPNVQFRMPQTNKTNKTSKSTAPIQRKMYGYIQIFSGVVVIIVMLCTL